MSRVRVSRLRVTTDQGEDAMVSRVEATKDTAQVMIESTATHVGRIATIITSAVRDVVRELGELATDAFEMREAAQKASAAGEYE